MRLITKQDILAHRRQVLVARLPKLRDNPEALRQAAYELREISLRSGDVDLKPEPKASE